ncbi:MAG: hypothetical protein IIA45_04645 [Bacteroidetes bacterium]|nr:hypothetical protein [Bacteroidota bacterium]
MVTDFLKEIASLKNLVFKSAAININSQTIKQHAITVAREYFSELRTNLYKNNLLDESDLEIDNYFQDLLRLAQGNNSKKRYVALVKIIEKSFKELSVKETSFVAAEKQLQHSDKLIIETLQKIAPTAALSYEQALIDLNICNHKISFRGTASELREALREILDHLSPDKNVSAQPGFKLEQNQTKPTMKQKVQYILKQRSLNQTKRTPAENSVKMVEELMGQMARAVYNRASLSTHLETNKQEVLQIKRYVDIVFFEILELG